MSNRTTQKALVLEALNTPLAIRERPIPQPGPGELLVRIHASGLNPVDWKIQVCDLVYAKLLPPLNLI